MLTASFSDQVSAWLREVAHEQVLPRFQRLRPQDIEEKAPGELVTLADRQAELSLTPKLEQLLPGSRVVGEESVAVQPELLSGLEQGWVWLVDPVDGTSNFVQGLTQFAMMVSLLQDGIPRFAWILEPISGRLWQAESGAGSFLDGERIRIPAFNGDLSQADAIIKPRFLAEPLKQRCAIGGPEWPQSSLGSGSCGIDYPQFLTGQTQIAVYGRTLAWDHAPGSLLIGEAGGYLGWLDGSAYQVGIQQGRVLLVAANPSLWHQCQALLNRTG